MRKFIYGLIVINVVSSLMLAACGGTSAPATQMTTPVILSTETITPPVVGETFFDDFNYKSADDPKLLTNQWTVRAGNGGPGMSGVRWLAENTSFMADPDLAGNQLMQLSASTDGSSANTTQAEIYQQRKFYEGTYASRVRFTDAPVSGPDGDQVNETFFTITPLNFDFDPDYGEIDFEYLANGGWGSTGANMWMTTWETLRENPSAQQNKSDHVAQSLAGWHTLVMQVADGEVKYFVDGALQATHGGKYYPETPMSINYNLWFIDGGMIQDSKPRNYIEQVDWLLYAGKDVLTSAQVDDKVAAYRAASVGFQDTVPAWTAPPFSTPVVTPIPATPTRAPGAVRPFEQKIHHVKDMKIDGELSDWSKEPTFTLNDKSQIVYAVEDNNWNGPADFSTQAWAGWAEDGLYLAFNVTDDKIVQKWTGGDLWQGDYLEIQIDSELEKDFTDTQLSDDDYQIGITAGNFADVAAETHIWSGAVNESKIKEIKQAQVKTANGYIVEVFIPKDVLKGFNLVEGAAFGMNVSPSDTDDPEVPQKLMMSTSLIRVLTDPTTFGKIMLVP